MPNWKRLKITNRKNCLQYFPLQMFWNRKLTDSTAARFTTLQLSQKGPLQQLMRFQNVVHTSQNAVQHAVWIPQCGVKCSCGVLQCVVLLADQIRVHRSQCTAWCEQIAVPFVLWQKCTLSNTQHILAESFRASRHPWLSSASVHSLWPTPLSAFFQT